MVIVVLFPVFSEFEYRRFRESALCSPSSSSTCRHSKNSSNHSTRTGTSEPSFNFWTARTRRLSSCSPMKPLNSLLNLLSSTQPPFSHPLRLFTQNLSSINLLPHLLGLLLFPMQRQKQLVTGLIITENEPPHWLKTRSRFGNYQNCRNNFTSHQHHLYLLYCRGKRGY